MNQLTSRFSFEQQRLVLLATLTDPQVVNVASSLGVNVEEASVHRAICYSIRKQLKKPERETRAKAEYPIIKSWPSMPSAKLQFKLPQICLLTIPNRSNPGKDLYIGYVRLSTFPGRDIII